MILKFPRVVRSVVVLVLVGLAVAGYALVRPGSSEAETAGARPRTLLIAVDGLSWEAFDLARQRGMFKRFRFAGRQMAPYPSMSHPAWNEIVGTRKLFGARGNVRTIEARWFDLEAMRVADDPRQVFAKQVNPYAYQRAWDYFFDPLIEPLQYLRGQRLFDRELSEAERHILDDFTGEHYVSYVGGLDAMAHTHKDELWPYLARFDAMINRVADSLDARGTPADIWLVSDHGNSGGFREGAPERYLTPVSLDNAIRRAGLVRRDTGRLTQPNQVANVTIALASMVNFYFADLGRRRALATQALAEPGVELATWLEITNSDRYVVILAPNQEARLRWRTAAPTTNDPSPTTYSYERIRGNPLAIPDSLSSRWVSDAAMRAGTVNGPYPDAPFRLVQSATKQVENAPDLIVSLHDGYAHKGDLGRFVQMVRTHGTINARATFGIVASSSRSVPSHIRGEEVLGLIGLPAESLFTTIADLRPRAPLEVTQRLANGPGRVATAKSDETYDMKFLRKARPVALSLDYFSLDAMRVIYNALKSESEGSGGSRMSRSQTILKRANVVDGVSKNVDTLIALVDSLGSGSLSSRVDRVERQLRAIPELAPLTDLRGVWSRGSESSGGGSPIRRTVMALWTVPYFLDAALTFPETDSITDTRDLRFAQRWHGGERARIAAAPARLLDDSTLAPRLFSQVFTERRLWRAVEPATIPLVYDPDVSGTTLVYVPGIYDELFDGEIWSRGVRSVSERLGMRTLTVPVDGRCGSSINATRLIAALRDDTRRRHERGYATPNYLIVGYSKGGIDATEAIVRAPDLARSQIRALVTVATPHMGTPVAERADVPAPFVRWAVPSTLPVGCDSTSSSESLWPATRSAFWGAQREGQAIAPLTRFFSVSFVTDAPSAHPWMKLTKQIGQFSEPNDGVVALSSSRFPRGVDAIDLGVVTADHIAGRLASSFPQDAFLEAVVITVAELGALRPDAGEQWRTMIASRDAGWWNDLRRRYRGENVDAPVAAFAASLRTRSKLPGGTTGWAPSRTFRLGTAEDLADQPIREMTPDAFPDGIRIRCDQRSMVDFRREYEFYYDAGNGGSENSRRNGFSIVATPDAAGGRACHLATTQVAIKMTTVAYRFRPGDFPRLRMRLRVAQNPVGIDPGRAGNGKNDAAFKVWFILRDTRRAEKNSILFGYTWNGRDARGVTPPDGALIEAYASKRNVVVKTLPEAWLVTIGTRAGTTWQTIEKDIARDLQRAYPQIPLEALQVIGVSIQSDSDATSSASEVFLESLDIQPRPAAPVAAGTR